MGEQKQNCSFCGSLVAQMRADGGISHRQYAQLLLKLMELEKQGDMELYAGDCSLEDSSLVLDAEQHYTVSQYVRCCSCGALYFVGACIRGTPVFRQVKYVYLENLWGRCGTYFLQN